jgi:hypothetical protein
MGPQAMADHKDEKEDAVHASGEPQAKPEPKAEAGNELPQVESPPLSPATEATTAAENAESDPAAALKAERPAEPAPASARPRLSLRHKRQALLAASVLIAAGLGAAIGVVAASPSSRSTSDAANVAPNQAMQQSMAQLSKQVAALKLDLDKTKKAAHAADAAAKTQIAKIKNELQDEIKKRVASASKPEITGTIPESQRASAVPVPRPAPRIAAVETRPAILPDWTVSGARGGFVYVQGHGDIYQVVPGARLPGLGPVQSIERHDGRWVVVTPDGIIVAARDRGYFE